MMEYTLNNKQGIITSATQY